MSFEHHQPGSHMDRRAFFRLFSPEQNSSQSEKAFGILEEHEYILNGVNVRFLGVEHGSAALEEYGNEIRSGIHHADIVISEHLPFEATWTTELSPEERVQFMAGVDKESVDFFAEIASMAQRANKRIAGIDPQTYPFIEYENSEETLSGLVLGSYALVAMVKFARDIATRTSKRRKKHKLSRRIFLWLSACTLLQQIQINFNNIKPFWWIREQFQSNYEIVHDMTDYGLDDQLLVDALNYRNMAAAQSLRRVCAYAKTQGLNNITVVYGLAHMEPMMHYALELNLIEQIAKFPINSAYNVLGEEKPRLYRYNNQQDAWEHQSIPGFA